MIRNGGRQFMSQLSTKTINEIVINILRDIMDLEEKAIITEEFKDITNNDMHIIEAIGMQEPKSMSVVAACQKVTVGTLTIAINNLVKKGYVNRQRGAKDRRVVLISLTKKGEAAYLHHEAFHKKVTKQLTDILEEQEIEVLFKAMTKLEEYLKELV